MLFAAELPLFRPLLPQDLLDDMATFRAQGKAARQLEKEERAAAKAEGRKYVRPAVVAEDEAGVGDEGASKAASEGEAASPPGDANTSSSRKALKRRRPQEVD